jgi:outer membrane beta-barrel protein
VARHRIEKTLAVAVSCCWLAWPALARAAGDDILDGIGEPQKTTPSPQPAKPAASTPAPSPRPAAATTPAKLTPAKPAAAATPAPASDSMAAAAPSSLDRVKAVPRKTLLKRHRFELSPFGQLSLNDAYYQHFAVGGTAIFYLHDSFGIGVGGEYLFTHLETQNIDAVKQTLISVPAIYELPSMFLHVDAYLVPLYGKLSLFSSDIIHFDTYLVGGVGAAFAGGNRRPAVNLGLGQRFVFGEWLALRVELRDHMFVDTQEVNGLVRSGTQHYVLLMVGASVFLPLSFEYSFQ